MSTSPGMSTSPCGWPPSCSDLSSPDHRVARVGGVGRVMDAEDPQVEIPAEPVEEPLAGPEDHGCHRDRELVDDAHGQRLPDHVGPTADADDAPRGLAGGPAERLVER